MKKKFAKDEDGFLAYQIEEDTRVELHLQQDEDEENGLTLPSAVVVAALSFCSLLQNDFDIVFRKSKSKSVSGSSSMSDNGKVEVTLPAIRIPEKRVWIGGLCSVLRFLLRRAAHLGEGNEQASKLLGFQGEQAQSIKVSINDHLKCRRLPHCAGRSFALDAFLRD